jgi:hypothetical protein
LNWSTPTVTSGRCQSIDSSGGGLETKMRFPVVTTRVEQLDEFAGRHVEFVRFSITQNWFLHPHAARIEPTHKPPRQTG